jgi:hypothetical protein
MGSKMKIYRNANNVVINIGEWDDKDGLNPLPEGATEHDAEVVIGYDGGLYLADDPRRLQPAYQAAQIQA